MSGYQNKLNLGTTSTKNLTELTASTNRKTNTFASTYAFVLQLVSDTMDVIQLWDPSHTENATQLSWPNGTPLIPAHILSNQQQLWDIVWYSIMRHMLIVLRWVNWMQVHVESIVTYRVGIYT